MGLAALVDLVVRERSTKGVNFRVGTGRHGRPTPTMDQNWLASDMLSTLPGNAHCASDCAGRVWIKSAFQKGGVFVRDRTSRTQSQHIRISQAGTSGFRYGVAHGLPKWIGWWLCVMVVSVLATDSLGEEAPGRDYPRGQDARGPVAFHTEFQFARLQYHSARDRGFGRRWLTDWPAAEQHLLRGLKRLTRINTANEGRLVAIMDDDLFDYPMLYAVEPGRWQFTSQEAERLREYLLRGGFLMVDDFHGSVEWRGFAAGMRRIFPDRQIVEIPEEDSVFHTVYELDELIQIPGIGSTMRGVTYERDGLQPHWRGIYDDRGHLMVVINFNMDLGDAWEHADVPQYALRYTNRAYKHAINYIVYAMTH